jgi:hypothetical protein
MAYVKFSDILRAEDEAQRQGADAEALATLATLARGEAETPISDKLSPLVPFRNNTIDIIEIFAPDSIPAPIEESAPAPAKVAKAAKVELPEHSQNIGEPTLLSDGRRLWRFPADSIPAATDDDCRDLAGTARTHGVVLVADGRDLIVVERWLSTLPDEIRHAIAANAGGIIALLRGESRERCATARELMNMS